MSFMRKRNNAQDGLIPNSEDADNTYVARLAREEAENDWKNKSRHEKVRLARIEMRKRKKASQGFLGAAFWRKETIFIVALGLIGICVLLFLLHHRAEQRKTTGHGETWRESVEEVFGL